LVRLGGVSMTIGLALLGGALIGLSASGLLFTAGRIAGISGIFAGVLDPSEGDIGWRVAFVAGLATVGLGFAAFAPWVFGSGPTVSNPLLITAGLLVGLGVRMGNGCTSGHGVCGLSRRSRRSFVATLSFMASGAVVASLQHLLSGGGA